MHTLESGAKTTPLLPVLWSALTEARTPRAIRDLQWFLPAERGPKDLREQFKLDWLHSCGI